MYFTVVIGLLMIVGAMGGALWNQNRWFVDGVAMFIEIERRYFESYSVEQYAVALLCSDEQLRQKIIATGQAILQVPASIVGADAQYSGEIMYEYASENRYLAAIVLFENQVEIFRRTISVDHDVEKGIVSFCEFLKKS